MALPSSFLGYQNFRHLKLMVLLLIVAVAVYAFHDPIGGRHGGTVVGYGLGALSAALVLWLLWFGVRRRQYAKSGAPVKGWLSAHVYLGTALLFLVPLHSAFQFGWNVHTLAYALLVLVVVSGIAGVLTYTQVPGALTRERAGRRLDSFLQEIADIDAECQSVAAEAPDTVASAVIVSLEQTQIGGGFLRQLSGRRPECGTRRALRSIEEAREGLTGSAREDAERVAELLARKDVVLTGLGRDLRLRAILSAWLFFHVPLSLATVAAVGVHVFTVFWYW